MAAQKNAEGRKHKPAPKAMQQPRPVPVPAWVHLVLILLLAGASVALYHGTLSLGFFNLDDPDYISKNPYLSPVSASNVQHIVSTPYFANYSPGHLLSYSLDIAVAGGKNPDAMHLSSVLWYALVVGAVYLMGLRVLRSPAGAFAAAVLFLVHPVHVEVVAWLSSRKDLVATAFAVLSAVCYLAAREHKEKRWWWYAASVFGFLLASSGKQSVILLPLVFLGWDLLVEKRWDRSMVLDKAPYLLISAFFGWMTWEAQPSTRTAPNLYVLASSALSNCWLLSGFADYVMYRPRPNPAAVSAVARWLTIICAGALWLVPLALRRLHLPQAAALVLWVLVCMLPPMALSFLTPVTDRYLFLPSVGFCILLSGMVAAWLSMGRKARVAAWLGLSLLACVWTWKTVEYIREWKDPRSVWFFAASKAKSCQAYEYSGSVYHDAAERTTEFLRSGKRDQLTNDLPLAGIVVADPGPLRQLEAEWTGSSSSRTNSTAYRDRLLSLAWEQYENAVTNRGTLNTPNLYNRRGMVLVSQGQHEKAIREFKTGLELVQTHTYKPFRLESTVHLQRAIGVAYWNLKSFAEARDWLRKAQDTQRESGRLLIPSLDGEVERITRLAPTD